VFSTLWTDALGNKAGKVDPTFVSEEEYGERVYSKIGRFIVVREGERSVSCLLVTSYANQSIRKSGIRLDEHGFIYTRRESRKVEGMCSGQLKLDLAQGGAHLKDPSIVNVRPTLFLLYNSRFEGPMESAVLKVIMTLFLLCSQVNTTPSKTP
jgi:hypothetical protein